MIIITNCGVYRNIYSSSQRDKYGHLLYFATCSICGQTVLRRKIDIKRNCAECQHNKLITYIKDKRIRGIFAGMKDRCYNANNKSFSVYGGKGIKICSEWLKNPATFESWSLRNGYAPQLTIDRMNPDGDYSLTNCRWISKSENSRYKSGTNLLDVNGEVHSGREWSNICGFGKNTINRYLCEYEADNVRSLIELRRKCRNIDLNKHLPVQTWFEVYGVKAHKINPHNHTSEEKQ